MSLNLARRIAPADTAAALTAAGFHPLLAQIFAARGITSAQQLAADASALFPLAQLRNVERMASLLADAIAAQTETVDRRRLRFRRRDGVRGRHPCAARIRRDRRLPGAEPLRIRLRAHARNRRAREKAQGSGHPDHGRQRHRERRRRRRRERARHARAHYRSSLAGRRAPGCLVHHQPESTGLRLPEQEPGRRRRDVLPDAGAAGRVAQTRRVRRRHAADQSWRAARSRRARHRRRRREARRQQSHSRAAGFAADTQRQDLARHRRVAAHGGSRRGARIDVRSRLRASARA